MSIIKRITYHIILQVAVKYASSSDVENENLRTLNRDLQSCSFYVAPFSSCFAIRDVAGCDNYQCQNAVCGCDPYCCDVIWDSSCVNSNYFNPGCTSENLCCKSGSSSAYSLGSATVFGSGCTSVSTMPSPGGLMTLSGYQASTSNNQKLVRKTCDYAIPIDVNSGYKVTFSGFYYSGNTYVPSQNSETRFVADHFLATSQGSKIQKSFSSSQSFSYGNINPVVTPCGGSMIFRINTAILAKKQSYNTADSTIDLVQGFSYTITAVPC